MLKNTAMDLRTLSDLRTPWCLHVVATLRIADHLAAGVRDIEALATAADCDAVTLRRVLRHLVRNGVFEEPEPGRFALNEPGRQLLDESIRLCLDLDGLGGRFAHAWGTLLDVVRTGRPAYDKVFGRPYWEDLDAHPEIGASFDALMGPVGHGPPDARVLIDDDWDLVRTVVDVGGGTGTLLAAILQAHPHLDGTLVDLPRTVAGSIETFRAAGVEDRVTVVGQSFFEPLPMGADLYVLSSILNDWPERETVAILTRCAEAARPSAGRVVVKGGVTPDQTSGDHLTVELVLLGGRNVALPEFRELTRQASLEVTVAGQSPSGAYVVECRPID